MIRRERLKHHLARSLIGDAQAVERADSPLSPSTVFCLAVSLVLAPSRPAGGKNALAVILAKHLFYRKIYFIISTIIQ
jgi:hypothetical protein